jgi:hypothetical protein
MGRRVERRGRHQRVGAVGLRGVRVLQHPGRGGVDDPCQHRHLPGGHPGHDLQRAVAHGVGQVCHLTRRPGDEQPVHARVEQERRQALERRDVQLAFRGQRSTDGRDDALELGHEAFPKSRVESWVNVIVS